MHAHAHAHPLYERFRPLGLARRGVPDPLRIDAPGLLVATGPGVPANPLYWLDAFGMGLGYDLLAFVYLAWPLVLVLWLLPRRWLAHRSGSFVVGALCLRCCSGCCSSRSPKATFWQEFQSRFNFIAVDYLVYTNEVIGNIRESYPVGWILAGARAAGAACCSHATRRWRWRADDTLALRADARAWSRRGSCCRCSARGWSRATRRTAPRNTYVNELAGNGIYQFFAAYRSNELDYDRYYRTLPLTRSLRAACGSCCRRRTQAFARTRTASRARSTTTARSSRSTSC